MQGIRSILSSLLMALALIVAVTGNVSADIELPAGHAVEIVFSQDVSSKYVAPGDLVPIRLSSPITFGGFTVVKEGTSGSARVKSVTPAGRGGKPGSIELELLELEPGSSYEAEGDKKIMLKAVDEISAAGKSKKLVSWLLIFGLFIKGGQGEIPADQPFKAEIAEDIVILMD
ncbi:MAG: hypothetical protein OEV49_02350 [candidate division Zixibacteria bacterium]|nr:hypothetical protein [candidate division Zixibacteria bacterium]MDH3937636.1 hypothetical protein [candidate division Zixibacteria bacterium]MDH4034146.1 hypothetical protein [candidate division Zixibacteria bacterium]